MNCEESLALLSAYIDGELSSDDRVQHEVHLDVCTECLAELAELRRLAAGYQKLPSPKPPKHLWTRIDASLAELKVRSAMSTVATVIDRDPTNASKANRLRRRPCLAACVAAAAVLFGIAVHWSIETAHHDTHHYDPLANYAAQLSTDVLLAQQRLTSQYSGRKITADEAFKLVGYRPANVELPPADFTCDSLYFLDMPCCKCVEAVWTRDDGSGVLIFEHVAGTKDWFKGHPSVELACAGKKCQIVELGNKFAASWGIGRKTITVVGLRDMTELAAIISALM